MVKTRSEAKRLEYEEPLQMKWNGKMKHYEEVFINSGGEYTQEEAEKHLEKIREGHPTSSNWYCPEGHEGTFKDVDGLWYAYRHHAKYS
ncbi:MAG: hypothetical protein J6K45_05140 [Clostridia bacterium]|nr:hypothetical protein [Clostridia bacterium]